MFEFLIFSTALYLITVYHRGMRYILEPSKSAYTDIVFLLSSKLHIKARVDELYMLSFMLFLISYRIIREKPAIEMKLNLTDRQLILYMCPGSTLLMLVPNGSVSHTLNVILTAK